MHIAIASGLGLEIDTDRLVLSAEVRQALERGVMTFEDIVTGGDDYELVLAVPPEYIDIFMANMKKHSLNPYVAGGFSCKTQGAPLVINGSNRIDIKSSGWKHF